VLGRRSAALVSDDHLNGVSMPSSAQKPFPICKDKQWIISCELRGVVYSLGTIISPSLSSDKITNII
jgi:hypothetical protein